MVYDISFGEHRYDIEAATPHQACLKMFQDVFQNADVNYIDILPTGFHIYDPTNNRYGHIGTFDIVTVQLLSNIMIPLEQESVMVASAMICK